MNLDPGAFCVQSSDNRGGCVFNASLLAPDVELSLLQPVWNLALENASYYRSPLFPIVLGVGSFFLFTIPFTVIDFVGREWRWAKRYRIHPETTVTWSTISGAVALTLWNQVLYILPVSVAQCVWTPDTDLPLLAPPLWQFLWHALASLIVYDFAIYVWHVVHHRNRWLYRNVHSVHHRSSVVHCWVSQYVHPWELFCVGLFGTTAPWVVGAHPMTCWGFMTLNAFLGVETHSGYDFPIMLHRWFPFFGGTVKHEMHHQRPLVNFQPYFTWFDLLTGTECPGILAGGVKPKSLLEWEEKEKRLKRK